MCVFACVCVAVSVRVCVREQAVLEAAHGIHSSSRVVDPVPSELLQRLVTMVAALSRLVAAAAPVAFECAKSPHFDAVPGLLLRDAHLYARSLSTSFALPAEDAPLWDECVASTLRTLAAVANAGALPPQPQDVLHAVHMFVRRHLHDEVAAGADDDGAASVRGGGSGAASVAASAVSGSRSGVRQQGSARSVAVETAPPSHTPVRVPLSAVLAALSVLTNTVRPPVCASVCSWMPPVPGPCAGVFATRCCPQFTPAWRIPHRAHGHVQRDRCG